MPVTHGVAGSSPVRTANGKVLIMQIIKTFFLFIHNRISYYGSTPRIHSIYFQFYTLTFSTKLEFAKMICYLSFYVPEPFVYLCFGYDRCLVTDTDHLSSIINFGTDFGKMPGVSV